MVGFRTVFERAVARGEVPEGHNPDLLARLFPALALQHLVMSGDVPDARLASQIMAEVVYPWPSHQPHPPRTTPGDGAEGLDARE